MKTLQKNLPVFFKTFSFIFILAALFSCEGPAGYDGIDGKDGGLVYADVYALEGTFTASNDYRFK